MAEYPEDHIFTIWPELEKWWSPLNGDIPKKLTRGMNIKYYWRCPDNGHDVPVRVCDKIRRVDNVSCSKCYRSSEYMRELQSKRDYSNPKRIRKSKPQLPPAPPKPQQPPKPDKALKQKTPSLYQSHKDLMGEWHPSNSISPKTVVASDKTWVTWNCSEHLYAEKISKRAIDGVGCRVCSLPSDSIHRSVYALLNENYDDVVANYYLNQPWGTRRGMSLDYVLDETIAVEYDGVIYHMNNEERDMRKTCALLGAGMIVVRLREAGLPDLPMSHPELIQVTVPANRDIDALERSLADAGLI